MPVFQSEKWLEHSISSILDQTYQDYELILVNDGSTDKSAEICDLFTQKDGRIRTFHQNNKGVSAARNKGLLEAKGKYIMFVDSDDTIAPNTLHILMTIMCQYDVDLILFDYQKRYQKGYIEETCDKPLEGKYSRSCFDESINLLLKNNIINNIGTKLYKRTVIDNLWFDEKYAICEDIRFCLEVLDKAESFYFLDQSLYFYEIKNECSLMHRYKKNYREAFSHVAELVKKNSPSGYYRYYLGGVKELCQNAMLNTKTARQELRDLTLLEELREMQVYLREQGLFQNIKMKIIIFLLIHKQCFCLYVILKSKGRKQYD